MFSSLRGLRNAGLLDPDFFLGFGSVWFADFHMAMLEFGAIRMISIESDSILSKRAHFNKPFRNVEVIEGLSHDILPGLMADPDEIMNRPGVIWLDYDSEIDDTKLDELTEIARNAADGTMLLTTFNVAPGRYGNKPVERLGILESIFGDSFPIERFPVAQKSGAREGFRDEVKLANAIATAVLDSLAAAVASVGRAGGFVPLVKILYRDSSLMCTVGGFLPDVASRTEVDSTTKGGSMPEADVGVLEAPPLTHKEMVAIRSLLPSDRPLDRSVLAVLGFDLSESQLDSFCANYLYYPNFIQTVSF